MSLNVSDGSCNNTSLIATCAIKTTYYFLCSLHAVLPDSWFQGAALRHEGWKMGGMEGRTRDVEGEGRGYGEKLSCSSV